MAAPFGAMDVLELESTSMVSRSMTVPMLGMMSCFLDVSKSTSFRPMFT